MKNAKLCIPSKLRTFFFFRSLYALGYVTAAPLKVWMYPRNNKLHKRPASRTNEGG